MGQGYEDHLVTQEAISLRLTAWWRKIDAQLCSVLWQSVDPDSSSSCAYKTCFKFWTRAKGLYTNDIQRLYKVASAIVHISQQDLDLSTYIGQIVSLKEEFLTVMPLTRFLHGPYSYWPPSDLEPIRDRFLVVHRRPWMMCLLASSVSRPLGLCHPIALDSSFTWKTFLSVHMARSSDSPPRPLSSSASRTSRASIASVAQPGNASALPTHLLLDLNYRFGASDHLSYGKTIGIGRESQGLYHLISNSSPAACISTDAPLLIHNRLATLVSPSSGRWLLVFHFVAACESCHLGNILVSRSQSV
ncbi:hypothetical protein AAG906_040751 [Vitis piasezkii]